MCRMSEPAARVVDCAKEDGCKVGEDADHDATVGDGDELGMVHDGVPTPFRRYGMSSTLVQ